MIRTVIICLAIAGFVAMQTKQVGPSILFPGTQLQAAQKQLCQQETFAKTVNCSVTIPATGWTVVVLGWAGTTSAMNAATMGCGTLTGQTGTTTTSAQMWSVGSNTSSGSCTVTQTTSSSSNVAITLSVWALSPIVTNGTIDATVTASNYATAFHSSGFSGPSVTGTTANDIYLASAIQNGSNVGIIVDSTNMPCTSDYSAEIGGAGGIEFGQGSCLVATAGAKAPHWTPAPGAGATFSTATIALQP